MVSLRNLLSFDSASPRRVEIGAVRAWARRCVNLRAMAAYDALTPSLILDAIESRAFRCDGRLFALNSYENRVYQAWLEDGSSLVAKFYRPQRWSDAAILEEHAFALELADREIPVVAPLVTDGSHPAASTAAIASRCIRGGPAARPSWKMTRRCAGSDVSSRAFTQSAHSQRFAHRPRARHRDFGRQPALSCSRTSSSRKTCARRTKASSRMCWSGSALLTSVQARCERSALHGDCHGGNILWTEEGPHFVDLDDARMGARDPGYLDVALGRPARACSASSRR